MGVYLGNLAPDLLRLLMQIESEASFQFRSLRHKDRQQLSRGNKQQGGESVIPRCTIRHPVRRRGIIKISYNTKYSLVQTSKQQRHS